MVYHIKSFFSTGIHIIEGYMKWVIDIIRNRMSPTSYERYTKCKKCEYNIRGICAECGCIIKAKVRVDFELDEEGKSIDGCPLRKW